MVMIWAGLLAGAIHVISGPDHLVALAPYSFQAEGNRMLIGLKWGLGHGIGIAVIALTVLGLKTQIDVSSLSQWAECFVGLLLVFIGIRALNTSRKLLIHDHAHEHHGEQENAEHSHFHVHLGSTVHPKAVAHPPHSHAPGWIGLLHGIAGTGHVFGLVPALGLSLSDAAVYMSAYIAASVLAMMGCVGSLGILANKMGPDSVPSLIKVAGATAVTTGIIWLYSFRNVGFELLGLTN
ncbi:MAG: hypothetical protein ACPGQS_07490 [Bradymonadia bacterium]